MTALSFTFAFVLMLGVLIFVHELGHFLVAKACGVRVLKFSLGFGTPIGIGRFRLRWVRNGTEYVVAWLPLGGYVKMLGENPEDADDDEVMANPEETLGGRPLWQKLAVVFAGPAMNLLLPVLIFTLQLAIGLPRGAPVVGTVEPSSPAATAGIEPGDEIVSIDGEPVAWWSDVEEELRAEPGVERRLEIAREGIRQSVTLAVAEREGFDEHGARADYGWAGLAHSRPRARLGIPDGGAPAAEAGLRSGDRVTAVAGTPVEDWDDLAAAYQRAAGPSVQLEIERGPEAEPETRTLAIPALGDLDALGVLPAGALVSEVSADSPAAAAGLEQGDLIVALNGEPLRSFSELVEVVRTSDGQEIAFTYSRDGETRTVPIVPVVTTADNFLGIPEEHYRIGISAAVSVLPGARKIDIERNPLVSVPRAVAMTAEQTGRILEGLQKLVTGAVPADQISGPIGIAVIAHKALQLGFEVYIGMLIMISINLAILNLLPIPVLDGGQALLFLVEGVKRSPLSMRSRELEQSVGITALLLLMGFAFWNDISRFWSGFVEYLRDSAGL